MTDTCYPSNLAGAELSELQRLLYERCESLDEVIVVLWLAAHRERAWSLEALSAELGIDEYALLTALKHLTDMGLVRRRGPGLACYRYDAELGGEEGPLARLQSLNRDDRALLVRLVLLNALIRLRDLVRSEQAGGSA